MSKYKYLLNFVQISCFIPPSCAGWRCVQAAQGGGLCIYYIKIMSK